LPINDGGWVETSTIVFSLQSHSFKERGHDSGLAKLVGGRVTSQGWLTHF
jgi:hypothetical protein